jgi:hypothetical protein
VIVQSGLGLKETALCELYNGDVDILCEWPNFKKIIVSLILIYFLFLFKLCSCLDFDLTIDLNP